MVLFKKSIALLICLTVLLTLLASCNREPRDPTIPEETGPLQGAQGIPGEDGKDGKDGKDGITPKLRIDADTNEWQVSYDDGKTWASLGVQATGKDGTDGKDGANGKTGLTGPQGPKGNAGTNGITPQLRIDPETNLWQASYDGGASWSSLGVTAKGEAGSNGITPQLRIDMDFNEWQVSYDNGETWTGLGVSAVGAQVATIEKVELDDQGRLVITLTDGTVLDPVEFPQSIVHTHTYGDRIPFGDNSKLDCDECIYYCVCSECYELKWTYGSPEDHKFSTEYSANGYYHWFACEYCSAVSGYEEHSLTDDGDCSVCEQQLTPTEGVVYALSGDGSYAEVINYEGTAKRVKIADEYMGVAVKKIGDSAFSQTDVISVLLPDPVTEIGNLAFCDCDALTYLDLSSVISIGNEAFQSCYLLARVDLGEQLQTVGDYAFRSDGSLSELELPTSVTSIGYNAFDGCTSLVQVENGVSYVGAWAVGFDNSVTTLSIRNGTVGLAYGACENANKPRSLSLPDSVKYIGAYAFYNCANLSSVTLENGVQIIGNYAFCDCDALVSIVIPDGVQIIGNQAFSYCDALTSVVIPLSVHSLGDLAFYCTENAGSCSLYYKGTLEDWNSIPTLGNGIFYSETTTLYFYNETPATQGNYWRYVDGIPTVWES